jgi:DNA (cytosine-5)-methyltransferase 1
MGCGMRVVDLFCGGGGESTGILQAAKARGLKVELHAVNHWEKAIETHSANHPDAVHYCTGVDALDPCTVVPGGRVELLWASPECTHHSTARGGRPCSDQSRASGWLILKWLQELYVERVIVENVPEFLNWGPLGADGMPLKSKKGATFRAWVGALESLGYRVDWRVLNAADFGAATTRRRLFVQAVRGKKRICWPEPTHSAEGGGLFEMKAWKPAREIIDWELEGRSIFNRKKPLALATLARIQAGIERYWGEWAAPFVVLLRRLRVRTMLFQDKLSGEVPGYGLLGLLLDALREMGEVARLDGGLPKGTDGGEGGSPVHPFMVISRGQSVSRELSRPAPTVSSGGGHFGLVEGNLVVLRGTGGARGVECPLPAVTAGGQHLGLVEPIITQSEHECRVHDGGKPLPTITGSSRGFGVAEPFLTCFHGGDPERNRPVGEPVPTVPCSNMYGLAEAFVLATGHKGRNRTVGEPLMTVVTKAEHCLVEPLVLNKMNGTRMRTVDEPVPTVTAVEGHGLLEPLLLHKMNGNRMRPVSEPVPTVTTGGSHGLLEALILHQMSPGRTRTVGEPVPTVTTTGAHALILPYYGQGQAKGADVPLATVTTKDRFALLEAFPCLLDIRFRMLQPRELAGAQSFPDGYEFSGTKSDQVRQIGNAVPPVFARALVEAALMGEGVDGVDAVNEVNAVKAVS